MKIVVLEHVTAAPFAERRPHLLSEGRAMRDAVAADLARLPGVGVVVAERLAAFRPLLRRADAALVIAPESDGLLESLCRVVEDEGRILLGPASSTVRAAADKLETARRLTAAGIPTPGAEPVSFSRAASHLRLRPMPFVIKPRDGCGCEGLSLVKRRDRIGRALDAVRRATRRGDFLVQDYVEGDDASVAVIAAPSGNLPIALCRQRIRRRGAWRYVGGETPWRHRLAAEALDLARAAVEALSPSTACRGFLGVDLVLGKDGVSVIEVNPRLTTSYTGLRHVIGENLAGLILGAATGRPLPGRLTVRGPCRFDASGAVIGPRAALRRAEGDRCRTISAGTSAASI